MVLTVELEDPEEKGNKVPFCRTEVLRSDWRALSPKGDRDTANFYKITGPT